jgi:hypothetical protein
MGFGKSIATLGLSCSAIFGRLMEPATIKRDDFVDRLGVRMRPRVRLSIELIFANHALSPIELRFDMVLQDAAGFGERFHDRISTACARVAVPIGCKPDVLPDRIFVLRHRHPLVRERRCSEQRRVSSYCPLSATAELLPSRPLSTS